MKDELKAEYLSPQLNNIYGCLKKLFCQIVPFLLQFWRITTVSLYKSMCSVLYRHTQENITGN